MPGQMVDRNKGFARPNRKAFGTHHAGQDPPDQARTRSNRDCIDFGESCFGLRKCILNREIKFLRMGAGGDFGNNTAIGCVKRRLAQNHVAQDIADLSRLTTDHGSAGVVATALDAQNGEQRLAPCSTDCAHLERQVTPCL